MAWPKGLELHFLTSSLDPDLPYAKKLVFEAEWGECFPASRSEHKRLLSEAPLAAPRLALC